jgi:MFS family permease
MSLTPILLFVHIGLMFGAVMISLGPALVMRIAEQSGQMALVRGVALASKPLGPAIPIAFISGGIFGLLTAINVGYNLLAPWLVIAYVLFLVAMITGAGINRTFLLRLAPLVKDAPDGELTEPVRALFAEPRYRFVNILDYVVILALIYDMVAKPFS